ncbi:MAG: uroporphyrinogen decarboxylase [Actinomycetes bacterium]
MPTDGLDGSAFLRACRGERTAHPPVWFMRQAGRALPEYRKVREGVEMLTACATPEIVAEITMQPVRRYGVDAAILFSDIVVPLHASGVDLSIEPGVGPVIADPVRTSAAVTSLPVLTPDDVQFVTDAVAILARELDNTPLIGFAGAPFTLASYLIEGGPSRELANTKALMYGDEQTWHSLLSKLADVSATYLQVQIAAGVSAVQLFDSWVGTLSAADYERYVFPHSQKVLAAAAAVPRIHFGVGTGELLALMRRAGADVVGVDWRLPLDDAAGRIGTDAVVQGNLDPALCLAPFDVVRERARDVITRGKAAAAHVFNLGHGVLPTTDPDTLAKLVDLVHAAD